MCILFANIFNKKYNLIVQNENLKIYRRILSGISHRLVKKTVDPADINRVANSGCIF
jgi:hypothetical protein